MFTVFWHSFCKGLFQGLLPLLEQNKKPNVDLGVLCNTTSREGLPFSHNQVVSAILNMLDGHTEPKVRPAD